MRLQRTNSDNVDFKGLITLLDENLYTINGAIQAAYNQHNLLDFIETVVIAYLNDEPAGCGCFKKFNDNTIEIKRMYTYPALRGKGIASAILKELEAWAAQMGYTSAVLETGTKHAEAISLYHHLGYVDTEKYEPYIDMEDSVCMRKVL
jgi:putative acetyltransferase